VCGGETKEDSEMVRDVLTYLVNNPDAQDTLEGIAEWWLLERKIESRAAKVKEVLADLVARGLILERRGSDSRLRYLINTDRQHEIRALLSKDEP
jgi:hypothetical protein